MASTTPTVRALVRPTVTAVLDVSRALEELESVTPVPFASAIAMLAASSSACVLASDAPWSYDARGTALRTARQTLIYGKVT